MALAEYEAKNYLKAMSLFARAHKLVGVASSFDPQHKSAAFSVRGVWL